MPGKFDFHVHTIYSDGKSEPLAMVEAAEARGMEAVALTDHGPELHVGILREEMKAMLEDIQLARADADIPVLVGMEANIVDENGRIDLDDDFIKKLDLLVVSIHTLGSLINPADVAYQYLQRFTKAIEKKKFDVMGHPFFFHQNLLPYLSREEIEDFVELAASKEIAMEINEKYHAPDEEFLKLCLRKGVKFSVGSDAHRPDQVGRIDWAMATLKKIGAKREDLILDDFLR